MWEKLSSLMGRHDYNRLQQPSMLVEDEKDQEMQLKTLTQPQSRILKRERWTRYALVFFVLSTISLLVAYPFKKPSDTACVEQVSVWCT